MLWFLTTNTKAVAVSDTPIGPFESVTWDTGLAQGSDSYFWRDNDDPAGTYYVKHNGPPPPGEVRGAHYVSQLAPDLLSFVPNATSPAMMVPAEPVPPAYQGAWPQCSEGGGIFKHAGKWYVQAGVCCCFCEKGANAFVWVSDSGPLGEYKLQNGSSSGLLGNVIPFNASSGMYLTGSQQFSVAQVPLFQGGEPVAMYIGQRFGSADDGLKCHDYQYWAPLQFLPDGSVAEMSWVNEFTLEIGVPESAAAAAAAAAAEAEAAEAASATEELLELFPAAAAAAAPPPAAAAAAAATGDSRLRGFVYTSYSSGGFSANASDASLDDVAATGVQIVEIMWTYYVANSVNATSIFAARNSPTDANVLHAIAAARARGLAVAMKLQIDCEDGVWRANIGTHFTSELQWTQWFANYTAALLHAADLARQAGPGAVAGFNVGTELDGTHGREAEWRAVIAAVRAALPGVPLWLGPNWGWKGMPGYTWVGFWDALDFLGVDMYAPLASHPDPTLAEAVAGWAPIVANLSRFSAANGGKKFVFAEIGYASFTNAAIDAPACCSGPPDPQTQAVLYQSFFDAVWNQPWLAGVFWWAWPENQPGGTPCSTGFDVFRKPAAAVLKAAYAGAGADAAAAVRRPSSSPLPATYAAAAAAPLVVYSDGVTTFEDWSWGAAVNLRSAVDPYPTHSFSASAAFTGTGGGYGGLCFRTATPVSLASFTALELDLRANASVAADCFGLSASLCTCDDCATCGLPTVPLDEYAPSSAPCTVPAAWDADPSAAHLVVPLRDLLGGGAASVARVQFEGPAPCNFAVDNVRFT